MNKDSILKTSLTGEGCLIAHESCIFLKEYFPFKFENYKTGELKAYFDKSIIVDSVENNNNGYITRDYTFRNKLSNISFLVKINDSEHYFYLNRATIKDNLFKSRNGVKINMTREEFFKTINSGLVNCDTFTIQEGDLATFYYFIFEKDRLKTIEIQQSE